MPAITEVVVHASGAVFAVDEKMTIVAWNHAAEQGLGRQAETVLGRYCYEIVPAVDADTGRPCYEQCPLLDAPSGASGWVHNRVLKARWRGGRPAHLDCMLLHYVLSTSEVGTLNFITPLGAAEARGTLRALSAIEALYPLMTRSSNVARSLDNAVRATLQATRADVAEMELLNPDTQKPFHKVRQALITDDGDSAKVEIQVTDLLKSGSRLPAVLVAYHPQSGSVQSTSGMRWSLTIPLLVEDRLLGTVSVGSRRPKFNVGAAARILFAVSGQLSVFLRWSLLESPPSPLESTRDATAGMLRFRCFGRFEVELDGQPIASNRFSRHKALLLLRALVAYRGRPLHRETLIEMLWPGADPAVASNNLRVVLHGLRHALEPSLKRGQASSFVISHGDLVYLDPSDKCWTDVEEFERLAKRFDSLASDGQADAALSVGEQAVRLYVGEYMEDAPFVDWCIVERERVRELYLGLARRLAALYVEQQRFEEAIAACRMALAADSLREETQRQLISTLLRAGRRDEALRQYETCRRLLWQELAVPPDEETQKLYQAILV